MVTKSRLLYFCYAACVIVFFGIVAVQDYLSPKGFQSDAVIQKIHESWFYRSSDWLGVFFFPGAIFVNVHGEYPIQIAALINIAIYLLIPYLTWKWVVARKKSRTLKPDQK